MIFLTSPQVRQPHFRAALRVLSLGLLALLAGCQRGATDATARGDSADRDALARQRLREVLDTYSMAQRYHDDAKLVVRYQLEGRPMENISCGRSILSGRSAWRPGSITRGFNPMTGERP